jgi:hypothetical protein
VIQPRAARLEFAADLQIVRGSLATMTPKASQAINVAPLGRYYQRFADHGGERPVPWHKA